MTATKTAARRSRVSNGGGYTESVVDASVSDSLHLQNRWKWTVQDFQRASDLGAFGTGARLELIDGEIIRKMTQKEPHAWAIRETVDALLRVFPAHLCDRPRHPRSTPPRSGSPR